MNELIYRQGGLLVLDEKFTAQPTAATVTIRTLDNRVLSVLDDLDDIEDEVADVDDLRLTLPATNQGAKLFVPTETIGVVGDLTSPGYRVLFDRGGRKYWSAISEYDTDGVNVDSFRLDSPVPFAIANGDHVYGLRISYDVDWSGVTSSTFVGRVKATWNVTVSGVVQRIVKIYDVVRQVFRQPATWADVLALRPDADTQLSHIADKEAIVTKAWQTVQQDLYTLGIRHNLIIADESTTLRDAVVMQALYNLMAHSDLPVPASFSGLGQEYLDRLNRDKERSLSLLQMPVDDNEDLIVAAHEENVIRRTHFFRSAYNHRQRT